MLPTGGDFAMQSGLLILGQSPKTDSINDIVTTHVDGLHS